MLNYPKIESLRRKGQIIFKIFRTQLIMFALLLGSTSCVIQSNIRADHARYPISLSGGLPTTDGRTLITGEDLVEVGQIDKTYWRCKILYSTIALGLDVDISDEVNRLAEAHQADGVTQLQVSSSETFTHNGFILRLLPIWPICHSVLIKGKLVKNRTPEVAHVSP